ncbi:hypothetical protein [Pseudomonas oryzihabitans]|nr:hypothetical protein [Pseudomonas psychrotolerans]MDR6676801.1 hypothetical protein [Pseudomonas psychrotolerans]
MSPLLQGGQGALKAGLVQRPVLFHLVSSQTLVFFQRGGAIEGEGLSLAS